MAQFPKGLHPLEQEINRLVIQAANDAGVTIYLVGGCLRDALSGHCRNNNPPRDFDYAVAGRVAISFAQWLAKRINGHFVLLDQSFDSARIVLPHGVVLDFAGYADDNIEPDLLRRDFTINALCWSPREPDEIFDPANGLPDLQRKTIRAICEQNLIDDPLRMLRAFRFRTTFGGTIDRKTMAMIKRHSSRIVDSAPERTSHELFTIAKAANSAATFNEMGDCGLLEAVFPELIATRSVPPNAFHHLGLWDHSLSCVHHAESWLTKLPAWANQYLDCELSQGISKRQALKFACLLHDIGKPKTWKVTPHGRHSFYGHDRLGSEMCEVVGERLKWSRQIARCIAKLVAWHLRPGQLFHQGLPTERAILRFYRTVQEHLPPLMVLAFGDLDATCGPGLEKQTRESLQNNLLQLLENFPSFLEGEKGRQRFLDGNEIMQILGIEPGPKLGDILLALDEAQGLNEVKNYSEAKNFVLKHYSKGK